MIPHQLARFLADVPEAWREAGQEQRNRPAKALFDTGVIERQPRRSYDARTWNETLLPGLLRRIPKVSLATPIGVRFGRDPFRGHVPGAGTKRWLHGSQVSQKRLELRNRRHGGQDWVWPWPDAR